MKITFCTTCQNYTHYLKQVYEDNLKVGEKYDCDFVLVNYNSTDDMDAWVKEHLQSYIDSGYLTYQHTTKPRGWDVSKAKNLAHSLGTGDILINLDADNRLTESYLDWILDLFETDKNVVTACSGHSAGGRVAVWREDFEAVGGYDESFSDSLYGIDHAKLCTRLFKILGRKVIDTPNELCPFLKQSTEDCLLAKTRSKLILNNVDSNR